MKKLLLLLFMLLVFILIGQSGMAAGGKLKVLPNLLKPDTITVTNDQFVVSEGASVHLYSLRDFRLQKTFGKEGEGPREFKVTSYGSAALFIDPQPECFLISSVGKLSLFTRDGVYIREMKSSQNFFGNRFFALGEKFAGLGSTNEGSVNYMTVNVYNGGLKKVTEVCRWVSPYTPGAGTKVFFETPVFQTAANKIFAIDGTDFNINVFGDSGKKLGTIHQDYQRLKVTKKNKDAVIHFFKTSPATKDVYQFIQPVIFPERLPAIRNLLVKDNRIYVVTYKIKENKTEFFVFNGAGKQLKHVYLPLVMQTPLLYYPYTVKDGKLYQLIENDISEEWELHVTNI